MSDSTRSGVGEPAAKAVSTWDRNTVESEDSASTATWMFGYSFSNLLTCVSVYWPSRPRPEMAKVIVWVMPADCCVVLADRCVVLVLELQAARLSRAMEATAAGTRLVLSLAMTGRPASPGSAPVEVGRAGLAGRDRAPHRSLRNVQPQCACMLCTLVMYTSRASRNFS